MNLVDWIIEMMGTRRKRMKDEIGMTLERAREYNEGIENADQARETPPVPTKLETDQPESAPGRGSALPKLRRLQPLDRVQARGDERILSLVEGRPAGCAQNPEKYSRPELEIVQDSAHGSPSGWESGEQRPGKPDCTLSEMPPRSGQEPPKP